MKEDDRFGFDHCAIAQAQPALFATKFDDVSVIEPMAGQLASQSGRLY